jgi:hypothetical protein
VDSRHLVAVETESQGELDQRRLLVGRQVPVQQGPFQDVKVGLDPRLWVPGNSRGDPVEPGVGSPRAGVAGDDPGGEVHHGHGGPPVSPRLLDRR